MENSPVFIILAGGKSERMGMAKGLLKFNKTFWILEQLRRTALTSIQSVYIGLGYQHQHYFEAIEWFAEASKKPYKYLGLEVTIVINETPKSGPFSTLQAVLNSVTDNKDVLVNPIDSPILNATDFEKIINEKCLIALPNYKGKNGHPVKLAYAFWQKLKSLDPLDSDSRLDFQIKKTAATEISNLSVSSADILLNINTPADWDCLKK